MLVCAVLSCDFLETQAVSSIQSPVVLPEKGEHFCALKNHGPWAQMASTNNVSCPEWLDWFHGGLQFQIE